MRAAMLSSNTTSSCFKAVRLLAQLERALYWCVELGGVGFEHRKALLYLAVVLDQSFDVVELAEANKAYGHEDILVPLIAFGSISIFCS